MSNTELDLKNKSVVIVTHRSVMPCIPGDDLKKFLLGNGCEKILYIRHPLLLLEESYNLTSDGHYFVEGQLTKSLKAYHFKLPEPLLYLKDFFYTLAWAFASNQKYDLYFGINNLNAFAGIMLKKLGRVKKAIYYTIDLYPTRFGNKLINWIYHRLDRYCVRNSDETWNVSPFLAKYRQQHGMTGPDFTRQHTVPIGIWYDEMKRVPPNKVRKATIAYVGHLKALYGVDLAIKALPLITRKIPQITLGIVGGGEQREELEALARSLHVENRIKFYGWKEKKEAEEIISSAALGLAPFNTAVDEKIKNADPAKIKDYLALGLPVITTNAPLTAEELQNKKCGMVIEYTPQSLANAVIKLLENNNLRLAYRKNALTYVKQFDWNYLFSKNISRLIES